MKGGQAIQRRLTEDHDQISAKTAIFAEELLRPVPQETADDGPRMIFVPEEQRLSLEQSYRIRPKRAPSRTFPYHEFASNLDPAVVKARYLVGPVDPTILFVGDLDDRHAPDLLLHAMPPVLKEFPQARLIVVGDGPLFWPLRVMSRYMLLDHATRIVGHVGGTAVRELIAATDIVAVPSRVNTEDWQVLSGWSARRPVVVTAEAAVGLCRHEENSVVVDPNPTSLMAGLRRVLSEDGLRRQIAENGYHKVVGEFGGQASEQQAGA